MIIARLQGGLGNQLFQYAAAKALASHLNTSFKLETITSLQKDRLRKIALNDLEAPFELASAAEVKRFVFFPSLYRHRPGLFSKLGRHIYREPHFHLDPWFFQLTDPVYLDGFWQSPHYFASINEIIRKDFTVKEPVIENVKAKGQELESKNSVAIHIRRGDLLNARANAYHGILDISYYRQAIERIKEKISSPSLHIFSDDIEWAKENLPAGNDAEYISAFTRSAIEDFYLMTKCRHNIIANSSFSWWTAWLNNFKDKTVIAPQNWFAVSHNNTADLIPSNWIRL